MQHPCSWCEGFDGNFIEVANLKSEFEFNLDNHPALAAQPQPTGKMAAAWARVRSDVAPKRQARPASSMFDVVMLFQVSVPSTRVCKIV